MYNPIKHTDIVTSLINHLRVIIDDMHFLQRTNQKWNLRDYPNFVVTVNAAFLDSSGNWITPNIVRVERLGFDIFKENNSINICTLSGTLVIPILPPQYNYQPIDWRTSLL